MNRQPLPVALSHRSAPSDVHNRKNQFGVGVAGSNRAAVSDQRTGSPKGSCHAARA
jgi:hypothetical protein